LLPFLSLRTIKLEGKWFTKKMSAGAPVTGHGQRSVRASSMSMLVLAVVAGTGKRPPLLREKDRDAEGTTDSLSQERTGQRKPPSTLFQERTDVNWIGKKNLCGAEV
jgi:hypothetical protein